MRRLRIRGLGDFRIGGLGDWVILGLEDFGIGRVGGL